MNILNKVRKAIPNEVLNKPVSSFLKRRKLNITGTAIAIGIKNLASFPPAYSLVSSPINPVRRFTSKIQNDSSIKFMDAVIAIGL